VSASVDSNVDLADSIGLRLFQSYTLLFQNNTPHRQRYICTICNSSFRRPKQLERHKDRLHSTEKPLKCPDCSSTFKGKELCEQHWHLRHSSVAYSCPECNLESLAGPLLHDHIYREHPNSIYALFGLEATMTNVANVNSYISWKAPHSRLLEGKDAFIDGLVSKSSLSLHVSIQPPQI